MEISLAESNGGGTGIRTLEPLVGVTRSPSVRLQPLGHPTSLLLPFDRAPATVTHELRPERRRHRKC